MFKKEERLNLPELEEKVLQHWRQNAIFEKTLAKNKGKKPFVFYEGPPTANGRPHLGHVIARVFKDIIPRYKTMSGYFVPRQAGWDTQGLPVEIEVEKKLGFKSKKDIEKYGIAEFNKLCRQSVWEYKDLWEKFTEKIGFWVDLKNPYITYENDYLESLWWIIKQFSKKKLLYQGHKIVLWCSRCGTTLSSHEVAQGYKEVEENSVFIKFKLKKGQKIGNFISDDKTYILSWTTTPWTLPGNVALAVGEKVDYRIVKNKENKESYILASALSEKVFEGSNVESIAEVKGKSLVGLSYQQLFDIPQLRNEKSHRVYAADFVTTEDGTGVVHTAVMYGEDDYELGKKISLPQWHTVSEDGRFVKEVKELAGMFAKTKDQEETKKTEKKILDYLQNKGYLLKIQPYKHDYPFCWRCNTPLLYYARSSWFVGMSRLRSKLLANNKKINWVPAHLKEGRFGEWLKDVKDWNFSRERYWGTPLPIWQCEGCGHQEVIGGREELATKHKANNRYWLARHGQAESNIKNIVDSNPKDKEKFGLTLKGRTQTEKLAKDLRKNPPDLIFASDFRRARETAEILAKALGIKKVIFDERLREINTGKFHGGKPLAYHQYFADDADKFEKRPPEGENLQDLAKRIFSFANEMEKKYKGKKILVVSHEYAMWMLESVLSGWDKKRSLAEKHNRGDEFLKNAEYREAVFVNAPRDDNGLLDFHRPFIDQISWPCNQCSKTMKRVKELADVWFDSGSMPFASLHYPFENKEAVEKGKRFPADYISEAIDQTRGWFYTLLAVATALGKPAPYKNVICLSHVLDKNGLKMSKSKGNVVDPLTIMPQYGIDPIRWHFYTMNQPGEYKNFDERDLAKVTNRLFSLVYNSFLFFEMYGYKNLDYKRPVAKNILDKWILARLDETVVDSTKFLNAYDIFRAANEIESLANDLSRWHIRRSRRRFQRIENQRDWQAASQVLGYVFDSLSRLLAPFTPFFAEALYRSLSGKRLLSVHLESWPKAGKFDKKLIASMKIVRELASIALAKRSELGIKVRQPLQKLIINNLELKTQKELLEILKDEINVKEIVFDKKLKEQIELDTKITPELREEGQVRELLRLIQDLRQTGGCQPKDKIILLLELPADLLVVVQRNEKLLKNEINAKAFEYRRSDKFIAEIATKFEDREIWLGLRKV